MTKKKTTRYVTIVTDGNGKYSYHSSWKSACEAYDWKYTAGVPKEKHGYKIHKAPLEVPIDCLDLIEFCGRKNVKIKYIRGENQFEIFGYNNTYFIDVETHWEHEPEWTENTDRGVETVQSAYDYEVVSYVTGAQICDEQGDPVDMKLDEWTKNELLNYLIIEV